MRQLLNRTAGALDLVSAGWTVYAVLLYMNTPYSCPADGCPAVPNSWMFWALVAVGGLLILAAAACFAGRWAGLPSGAFLSAVEVVFVALQWGPLGATNAAIAVGLGLACLVVNALAALSREEIPEQEHSLNLPVVG